MAQVTLIRGNDEQVVTTTRGFVDAVYNKGWLPKTGTVESNFEALLDGGSVSGADIRLVYSSNGTLADSIVLTQAAYNALPVKVGTTQYIIVG
jgi:hypothetical protein